MAKSPDAFRTISEVADWLGVQAHVLRFWESKFSQVKPIKRAGGRRYYRPNDMLLLGGIRRLLHEDGLTIKGVQKILREEGMSHVANLSQPLDDLAQTEIEDQETVAIEPPPAPPEEKGVVLSFEASRDKQDEEPALAEAAPEEPADGTASVADDEPERDAGDPAAAPAETEASDQGEAPAPAEPATEDAAPPPADDGQAALPAFLRRPLQPAAEATAPPSDNPPPPPAEATPVELSDPPAPAGEADFVPDQDVPPAPETPAPPRPRVVEIAAFTPLEDFPANPGALSRACQAPALPTPIAQEIAPLVQRLAAYHQRLSGKNGKAAAPSDPDE